MLLLIQMLFTVPVLQITKMVGWTDYSDFDFAVARKVFPGMQRARNDISLLIPFLQ